MRYFRPRSLLLNSFAVNDIMKQLYSTILLLAFAVGALQPVTPMVELFFLTDTPLSAMVTGESDAEPMCTANCIALTIDQIDCKQNTDPQRDEVPLLDVEYYPIPLTMKSDPPIGVLPEGKEPYINRCEDLINNYLYPTSPPPRHA
jgi:hypothetical protein